MKEQANQGCLALVFQLLGIIPEKRTPPPVSKPPRDPEPVKYAVRKTLLTAAESSFWGVLKRAVPEGVTPLAKVKLHDVVEVVEGYRNAKKHINTQHLDFLLVDSNTMRPMLALELDDSSHDTPQRKKKDAFKDSVVEAAGFPLYRVRVMRQYPVDGLREMIRQRALWE